MFSLKKKDLNLYSPVSGLCKDITECEDPVFSKRMIGDGFFINPSESTVVAPCDGIIKSLFPTKHAFCIEKYDGKQIMVHVGLDTVKLKGKGFNANIKLGDKVQHGQPLVQFDQSYLKREDVKLPVMVILLEDYANHTKHHLGDVIDANTLVMKGTT